MSTIAIPLAVRSPWQVLDGYGRSVRAACRYLIPRSIEELARTLEIAKAEGLTVAFRGAGRSYGDAALNQRGLVIDATRLDHMIHWEPETGIVDAQGGLTIEGLWRRTLQDGYWPAVVPGTMFPTLAGCLSMNIHGKNNFKVGPIGDHVLEFDLITPSGELLRCNRLENADVFFAAIGGLGLLGAITRVKLQLKRVESGRMRVQSLSTRNLEETFDVFESHLKTSDYLVGWVDCMARRSGLGRGIIHAANYLHGGEDPDGKDWLRVERQGLPAHIAGVPKSQLWKLMQWFANPLGMGLVNAAKYHSSWGSHGHSYLQSHAAFAFLLDYVPDWRLAYGPGGFIQYQIFVPDAFARSCVRDVLALCHKANMAPFLGVFKRHRPDDFLLSYALDGWSLAMDFRVTAANRDRLWALTARLTERVLAAGGKFYFAKDAVLRSADVVQAYGQQRIDSFLQLKQRLDPHTSIASDLWSRVLLPTQDACAKSANRASGSMEVR